MTEESFAAAAGLAMAGQLSVVDLIAAADRLRANGPDGGTLAVRLYQLWVRHNHIHPLSYVALFNLGVILTEQNDLEGARQALAMAGQINPDFMPAFINLGTVLERMQDKVQAINHWLHVVGKLERVNGEAVANKSTALKQIGRVLEGAQIPDNAEEALVRCLELDPRQRDAVQHWIALRQGQCKWPVIAPPPGVGRDEIMRAISPLSLAVLADDPLFQLGNAYRFHLDEMAKLAQPGGIPVVGAWPAPDQPAAGARDRLRIGYVSSDLREHAVGFLSCEVYGLHDRAAVEVFAYYCGPELPDDGAHDATQTRIRAGVDCWTDIGRLTDRQAAARILDDRIDILVDLNGYSRDGRLGLFALRPAPIVVNWLGFPGTMGTPYHNYLIADPVVLPEAHERYVTERVKRLPCYQPNDRNRAVAAHRPDRAEAGLPDDAVVFCCFNGSQKVNHFAFRGWMRILAAVSDSVLWLLSGSEGGDARLRQAAADHGIDPARLVFADKRRNPEHLARYELADLFLDTAPYGAHTTASDALWMGVPVLTAPGRAFASRVCASVVGAAGLPELVCGSHEEYVARAIALGRDRAALAALRSRLAAARDTCALFDTPALVRGLEALYREMWAEYARGALPRPELVNLECYREIGLEEDHEDAGDADIRRADYEGFYRTRLAYRDQQAALPPDTRLWTPEAAR